VDVEIQLNPVPGMRERALFYLSRTMAEQIKRGEDYRKIKRVICILIFAYEEIRDSPRYHNLYRFYDIKSGSLFSKAMEVNTLELPKLPKAWDETKLCAWLEFIRATEEEEFEMLAQRDPDIGLAVVRLKDLSQDECLRELAISREKLAWDIASREEGAREKGREEGREEGQSEAQRVIARKMLQRGRPMEEIMEDTGLSQADLLHLQTEGHPRH
jgi:predicted transposase/invertase (TIGR01784 family)